MQLARWFIRKYI